MYHKNMFIYHFKLPMLNADYRVRCIYLTKSLQKDISVSDYFFILNDESSHLQTENLKEKTLLFSKGHRLIPENLGPEKKFRYRDWLAITGYSIMLITLCF